VDLGLNEVGNVSPHVAPLFCGRERFTKDRGLGKGVTAGETAFFWRWLWTKSGFESEAT